MPASSFEGRTVGRRSRHAVACHVLKSVPEKAVVTARDEGRASLESGADAALLSTSESRTGVAVFCTP